MSSRLDSLFEEDVQMQDALEDLGSFTDNSDDIILGVIEDRAVAKESTEVHLFTNESSEVNEDGLTEEEEREIAMALLNGEDDDGLDEEDLIAMAMDIDYLRRRLIHHA